MYLVKVGWEALHCPSVILPAASNWNSGNLLCALQLRVWDCEEQGLRG